MGRYKGLILKTAAVVSAVSVLIIAGCQVGVEETAAVNNKSVVKETSIVSEKDREEDIETVVRSNGSSGQDTEDLRNDNEREAASDERLPEVTVEVKPLKDESGDAGEEDSTTGTDDNDGQSDESVLSVYESDSSAGWDGGMENDSAVSEYSECDSGWDVGDSEYSDSGIYEEAGSVDDGGDDGAGYSEESGANLIYLDTWTISFYCPCVACTNSGNGITASGTYAQPWHTAATSGLDFGTVLYVDGLGYFVVEDRGTEYGWLDVFVSDHSEALALGLQYRDVYLVN